MKNKVLVMCAVSLFSVSAGAQMSLSEANAIADQQTEHVHDVQLHDGTNSATALQAGAVAGQASVQRQQVSQQDYGAYRHQQVQDAHENAFGQSYTDAKNEVNQPASQPSSGYGQSYTDAKNNQSAGWAQQPGNVTNPQGNPVSMVAGIKQDPTGKPVTGGTPSTVQTQMQGIQATLTTTKYAAATINVAASSLQPTTQVNVTLAGVTKTVPASVLPPDVQVAIPHIPALIHESRGNGVSHDKATGRVSGDNRGSDNAHSHAFGGHGYGADNSRSEGFGGHSHFH